MGEIVHIQVGQCGNQIGAAFWEEVLREHKLDSNGYYTGSQPHVELAKSKVYFNQAEAGRDGAAKYRPRTLCVDLEPGVLNSLRQEGRGGFGNLLSPDGKFEISLFFFFFFL